MKEANKRWKALALGPGLALLLLCGLLLALSSARAFDEEDIEYFDPLDYSPIASRPTYSPTVSSIHFDLVGALAIAAGFSVTDAATIQAYSQGTDSGQLPAVDPVYTFDADPDLYPVAPPITSVVTSTHCPSPTTTAPTVTIGSTNMMTDCISCFTSRFGPYGVFFHLPHDRPDELVAIRDWALGQTDVLTGMVVFGYSSTAQSMWEGIANIYESTPCFVTETVRVDTGSIQPGSLEAFGIYLHALGDHWSHQACIEAADAEGLPFAAHVLPSGPSDPLWPCRWTSHQFEFGDPAEFPDSNRTFTATLVTYEALTAFAAQSDRPLYRSIPLTAEGNHLYDALYEFVHTATATEPMVRRYLADDLRNWSLATRAANPAYWKYRTYLPLIVRRE